MKRDVLLVLFLYVGLILFHKKFLPDVVNCVPHKEERFRYKINWFAFVWVFLLVFVKFCHSRLSCTSQLSSNSELVSSPGFNGHLLMSPCQHCAALRTASWPCKSYSAAVAMPCFMSIGPQWYLIARCFVNSLVVVGRHVFIWWPSRSFFLWFFLSLDEGLNTPSEGTSKYLLLDLYFRLW